MMNARGEPCVGPKQRMGRFEIETTMALLGQRRRSHALCG